MADVLAAFRFKVEIAGIIEAGFSECSGLTVETTVEEVLEGGVNYLVHKLPKGSKHSNLTLKRGLTTSDALWKWHQAVVLGFTFVRNIINVVVVDATGAEKWRWVFVRAYPVKWVGPDLKADSSTLAIETLEFAHDGFTKIP